MKKTGNPAENTWKNLHFFRESVKSKEL